MSDGEGGGKRRPKRRCVTRKDLLPSAVHYVGYVEDAETPEMIMKKFEALERVMAAQAAAANAAPAAAPLPAGVAAVQRSTRSAALFMTRVASRSMCNKSSSTGCVRSGGEGAAVPPVHNLARSLSSCVDFYRTLPAD